MSLLSNLVTFVFMDNLKVNDTVYGFRLLTKDFLQDANAYGYLFKHEKSGMKVYYIDADDKESVFAYSFATIPTSDSGVFHIIEHTVLSGSEKYRVKDPFMAVNRSSCNTYLNAMTYPDRTIYPAASVHEKDFDNIFSIYTDAVFKPLLREETFMQEGIRLVQDEKGEYSFDGVVYHEMEGALNNHESVVLHDLVQNLFPTTAYSYESGGDPKSISKLTYDEYLETFKKFYTPANAFLYLYGKNANLFKKLETLDKEYLQGEIGKPALLIKDEERWSEPRTVITHSPAMEESNKGSILLGFLTDKHNTDAEEDLTLSILVDLLLGNPTCPLYKAIIDSGLGDDLSEESGAYNEFYDMPFAVGFSSIDPEKGKEVETFILKTLKEICEKGFSQDEIDAVIARREFSLREIKTLTGLRLYFRMNKGWERDINPALYLNSTALVAKLREKLDAEPRYFEHWIEDNLIDNEHRLLLIVKPDSQYLEKEKAVIDKNLEELKGSYDSERAKRFYEFEEREDEEEDVKKLPQLTISDLPKDILHYNTNMTDDIFTLTLPQSGGIIYQNLFFDISDFSLEEMREAMLLSRIFAFCGTKEMTGTELQTKLRLLFGSFSAYLETGCCANGDAKAYFILNSKSTVEKSEEALSLLLEYVQNIAIKGSDVKAALSDMLSTFTDEVLSNGSYYMSLAASKDLSPSLYIGEYIMGVNGWKEFKALDKCNKTTLARRLERLADKIFRKGRVNAEVAADENDMALAIKLCKSFITSLKDGKCGPMTIDVKLGKEECAYISPTNVSFNALAFSSSPWPEKAQCEESIFASILTQKELWNAVRSKGGAYGAECHVDLFERTFSFSSYRDPRVKGTFDDFIKVLTEAKIGQDDLESAIITSVGGSLKPLSPSQMASTAFRQYLYGITVEDREKRRGYELSLTLDEIEEARLRVIKASREGSKATLVSSALYEKEELKFKKIELPF